MTQALRRSNRAASAHFHSSPAEPFPKFGTAFKVGSEQTSGEGCSSDALHDSVSLGRFRFGAVSFVERATGHDEITRMDILPRA
jgi:hypothetical protein